MKKINQKLSDRIIARAERHGSKSLFLRGAAKFCVQHKLATDTPSLTLSRAAWLASCALDSATVGQPTIMPTARIHDYQRTPLPNKMQSDIAYESAHERNPRKKNLYPGIPLIGGNACQAREEIINYKGKFKGYRGSELHADYQSCVAVTRSGRTAAIIIGCTLRRRIIAPAGLVFAIDHNGALLRRKSDGMDFHPTPEMWLSKTFIGQVRDEMARNFRLRQASKKLAKEQARHAKIKAREIGKTRVTLEDSRQAGNCVEGSCRFAELKLGIARQDILASGFLLSVPASRLLAVANGDRDKINAAVNAAWSRETLVSI